MLPVRRLGMAFACCHRGIGPRSRRRTRVANRGHEAARDAVGGLLPQSAAHILVVPRGPVDDAAGDRAKIMRSCFRTSTMKPVSFVKRSACLFTLLVTASRPIDGAAVMEVREAALAEAHIGVERLLGSRSRAFKPATAPTRHGPGRRSRSPLARHPISGGRGRNISPSQVGQEVFALLREVPLQVWDADEPLLVDRHCLR